MTYFNLRDYTTLSAHSYALGLLCWYHKFDNVCTLPHIQDMF